MTNKVYSILGDEKMKELKETVSWLNYYIKNFDIDRIIYFF